MRVLYVIDSLAPGGAETSLAALAGPLTQRGIDLHVLPLIDRPGVAQELIEGGATVHPALGATRRRGVAPLRERIREIGPDLVHTTLFEADVLGRFAARLERVPSTSSLVTTGYAPPQSSPVQRLRYAGAAGIDRITARWVVRLHAVSHAAKDCWGPVLHVEPGRIDVIHRGRDPMRLGRRSPERHGRVRDRLGIGPAPVVTAVARHDHAKGLDVLLSAWSTVVLAHPSAMLLLVGAHGRETSTLQRAVDALPSGSVRMLGHRDDVADLIVASDVLAAPSRREGLPGTIIEGMLLETPIVASDIAPMREVLGGDNLAALVPVDDAMSLAGAISAALSGQHPGDTVAGRQRALDHFTVDVSADRLVAFFERARAGATQR